MSVSTMTTSPITYCYPTVQNTCTRLVKITSQDALLTATYGADNI